MKWLILAVAIAAIARAWWRLHRRGARQRRLMLLCQQAGLDFAPLDLRLDTAWLPFPMFGHPKHGTENVVWNRRLGEDVQAFGQRELFGPIGSAKYREYLNDISVSGQHLLHVWRKSSRRHCERVGLAQVLQAEFRGFANKLVEIERPVVVFGECQQRAVIALPPLAAQHGLAIADG